MIINAKTYNAPSSLVYQESEKLKAFFEKGARCLEIRRIVSHTNALLVNSLGSNQLDFSHYGPHKSRGHSTGSFS
jgi:hypothetical protein